MLYSPHLAYENYPSSHFLKIIDVVYLIFL